jgi:methyl-accepting chemotaxis protein
MLKFMMTPEEIQKTIEGMLAVQKELQESQFKLQENQANINQQIERNSQQIERNSQQIERNSQQIQENTQSINQLIQEIIHLTENSLRQDRRIEQLIGYSITGESDRLNLEERVMLLERRIKKLEENRF